MSETDKPEPTIEQVRWTCMYSHDTALMVWGMAFTYDSLHKARVAKEDAALSPTPPETKEME